MLNIGVTGPNWQDRWAKCYRCQGLFYTGSASKGYCPAGAGSHDSMNSANYCVQSDPNGQGQPGWRWCNKCQGMFTTINGINGVCPADGAHDSTGSGQYRIPY